MESLLNPQHPLPATVDASIDQLLETHLARLDADEELLAVSLPSDDERTLIASLRERDARALGLDVESHLVGARIDDERFARVREALEGRVKPSRGLPAWVFEPPPPALPDPSFWWARTFPFCSSAFQTGWRSDGLWFTGGPSSHDGSAKFSRFGMIAFFELSPERMPSSTTGRFVSTPYVDLLGMFHAATSDYNFWQGGDSWSKCWLHLDQQLFQFGLGQDGPTPVVHAQNHERVTLVDEANAGRSVQIPLPGRRDLQPLVVRDLAPADSLWARLEVRFDIQIEGAAHLWIDSDAMVNTFHWPLVAL